jgi:hypothetical protein
MIPARVSTGAKVENLNRSTIPDYSRVLPPRAQSLCPTRLHREVADRRSISWRSFGLSQSFDQLLLLREELPVGGHRNDSMTGSIQAHS